MHTSMQKKGNWFVIEVIAPRLKFIVIVYIYRTYVSEWVCEAMIAEVKCSRKRRNTESNSHTHHYCVVII